VPGIEGLDGSAAEDEAIQFTQNSVLLKAAYIGGGKGMRVVREPSELVAKH
jgi:biotin carboxylase